MGKGVGGGGGGGLAPAAAAEKGETMAGAALCAFGTAFDFALRSNSGFSLLPCVNITPSLFMSVNFQPSSSSPTRIFR